MDITIKAHAKINLALDVVGKREDGYHNLRTIMQTVCLHDLLILKRHKRHPLKLVCNTARLPIDERNLVYQAALYLKNTYNIPDGLLIILNKNIPISAGLAGGSSDCAAVLSGINKMYKLGLSFSEMMEIAAKFGSDVPFCLLGGTALAEGKGEILTPLPPHPPVSIVIATPPVSISTSIIFKAFDTIKYVKGPNIDCIISSIKNKDIKGIASGFCNVLEEVSVYICPDIVKIKELFMEYGAAGALMSGSGPSVFAYFHDHKHASCAMKNIELQMPYIRLFLTGTLNNQTKYF